LQYASTTSADELDAMLQPVVARDACEVVEQESGKKILGK